MARYVAEKMTTASSARGKEKSSAQRECFEAILTLWEYQGHFPHDARPFKDFDPIFRALEHIDPNKTTPSFFRNENLDSQPPKEIEQAVKLIINLDAIARIMISFFVRESILHATNKSTLEWLDAISGIARSDETKVLLKFIPELDEIMSDQDQGEKRKNELSEYIDRLDLFESLSKKIKSVLEGELKKMELQQ